MNRRWVKLSRWFVSCGLVLSAGVAWAQSTASTAIQLGGLEPKPGESFDAAPFGMTIPDLSANVYGVRWADPRKIRRVHVQFQSGADIAVDRLRVEYWHRVWDGKADPVLAERGAGGVGWDAMDDWTNGQWKTAEGKWQQDGAGWAFTFDLSGKSEFKDLGVEGVAYRKTLAIRLVTDQERLAAVARFQACTDSVYRPLRVRVEFGKPALSEIPAVAVDKGGTEVFNGIAAAMSENNNSSPAAHADGYWILPDSGHCVLKWNMLMAVDPLDPRYDRTLVTLRCAARSFSFAADEVARGDRILIDDLGVLVTRADDPITLEEYRRTLRQDYPGRTIYDRVGEALEQTWKRAWDDMPLKRPLYFVHGLPGNRNSMAQEPNGDLHISGARQWSVRSPSPRDSERKLWDDDALSIGFGLPEETLRGGRALEEGYLPLLRTWWQDGSVYYEQQTVLDCLDGDMKDIAIDDPTVLMVRVFVQNVSETQTAEAGLRFSSRPSNVEWQAKADREEKLIYRDGQLLAEHEGGARLRLLVDAHGPGHFTQQAKHVHWNIALAPGARTTLMLAVPSITLTQEAEIAALRRRTFTDSAARVCQFWRELTDRGCQIQTPEPAINDFYKAHLRHMLVNCFKELDSDRLLAHVGTFRYGVYPNESVMMVSDLDRRGYHREARANLDAFLHYQGTVPLPGNYKSSEGEFYGAAGHEMGGYNKNHGYVCWALAEHWRYTRDRDWMARSMPGLLKACQWIIDERQATMRKSAEGQAVLEFGWLPSGSLEDVTDYWYWLSTNAATVWGFQALADALADYGHPQATQLQKEAASFKDDFLRGINESRVRCPVVQLRDGTYVPKIPSQLYERGRAHGWIRETLEGAIFLPAYQLLAPNAPETLWILKDYEDNLYISSDYGYSIPAFDNFWFSRGGISMQANLLDGPLPYLWRDDIPHFVRAYFNGLASAFYPETRMCNEHSLPELGYPAGDHFKSSDEAQSTYWLRLMFVNDEQGQILHLGQAIPRYWLTDGREVAIERSATHFGLLSFRLKSAVAAGRIEAVVEPPERNPPQEIRVRFRHPQAKPIRSVTLNGQPYDRFDASKEWVIIPGNVKGKQCIITMY